MEPQKTKIAMYAKRSLGEKLTASFDFIKENWKPLLKYTTYLILPICLVQTLSTRALLGALSDGMIANNMGGADPYSLIIEKYASQYLLSVLLSAVGGIVMSSLIYALIRIYNERDGRLQGIAWRDLQSTFLRNAKKMLWLSILVGVLMCVAMVVMVLFAAVGWFTLLITFPLFIVFFVPLSLSMPIYLFEDVRLMEAVGKSFRLGFATWGGVFMVALVTGIIGGVLQGVTMMPFYIGTMVKVFFAMSDTGEAGTMSVGYEFVLYLLGVLQIFGAYLSMIFTFVGLTYQYGHASEVVDGVKVVSDIENFDKL